VSAQVNGTSGSRPRIKLHERVVADVELTCDRHDVRAVSEALQAAGFRVAAAAPKGAARGPGPSSLILPNVVQVKAFRPLTPHGASAFSSVEELAASLASEGPSRVFVTGAAPEAELRTDAEAVLDDLGWPEACSTRTVLLLARGGTDGATPAVLIAIPTGRLRYAASFVTLEQLCDAADLCRSAGSTPAGGQEQPKGGA
jgi:hypothetical protein